MAEPGDQLLVTPGRHAQYARDGMLRLRAMVAVPNLLYYGDNLDVLGQHVKDETVDLVYLDPPFKSNADYNVLFSSHGTKAAAQIYDGEALTARHTGATLRAAQEAGLAVRAGRYWVATNAALDRHRAFEDRYLRDTEGGES